MNRETLTNYITGQYGVIPDDPFPNDTDSAVFRHPENKKWFALIMRVKRRSLAIPGDGEVDIVNLKVPALMLDSFLHEPGFLQAYHMNKQHWITALLEGGNAADEQNLLAALSISYELTAPQRRKRHTAGS